MNMANELDLRRKQEISGQQTLQTLADRLTLADHLVYKKYLTELRSYGLMPLSQEKLVAQDPMECIRMYQLKELTVKKGEDMFQKLLHGVLFQHGAGVQPCGDGQCAG